MSTLLEMFRSHGYDGTSVADVSEATGLGKSSLYHHFPEGKEQMARAVLEHLGAMLEPVFAKLEGPEAPATKLDGLLRAVDTLYDSGRAACILERLCASVDRAAFADPLREAFMALMRAFEKLALEAGCGRAVARERAEDAVVQIEGSLVLTVGIGDTKVFKRALARIRRSLLALT